MDGPRVGRLGPTSAHLGPRPTLNLDLARRRAVQDRELASFHAYLDEAAKDTRHKYERPQFAVVGEGSRTAQELYRHHWEEIFGQTPQEQSVPAK